MSRKTYWAVLFNPVILILYAYGLSVVSEFCKYGNVAKRLPTILAIFAAGVLWLVIWTILWFVRKKRKERGSRKNGKLANWFLAAELIALLLISGHYGYKIYQSAQPYNGKLWSYLNKLQTTREITLDASARNFLKNGLDGILDLLAEKCGLDPEWELYTVNTLKVTMDEDGTIQTIYAFLFALDDAGDYHAWLVDFDASKSDRMTVDLNNHAGTDYLEQKRLTPLLEMIEALRNDTELLADIGFAVDGSDGEAEDENETVFTLRYSGYADGNYQNDIEGTWYSLVPAMGDVGNDVYDSNDVNDGNDGNDVNDGNDETDENNEDTWYLEEYTMPVYGGSDDGFLLNIYREDIKVLTIITEAGTLETVAEIEERESEEAAISEAKQEGNTLLDDDSGGMTFYLNGEVSMSLVVTDAAAGSRAYAFQNGDIYNEDPFSGRSGVAESIYFLDENTGFLLLSNASSDASHLYYTDNGGVTFAEIFLPVSDGEADMAGNEFDFTPEDMDYIYTPYEEDGILYVEVSYDYSGRSYMKMLFQSEDGGSSWEYMLYEEGG